MDRLGAESGAKGDAIEALRNQLKRAGDQVCVLVGEFVLALVWARVASF